MPGKVYLLLERDRRPYLAGDVAKVHVRRVMVIAFSFEVLGFSRPSGLFLSSRSDY
jgi:hypothetical protein